MGDGRVAEPGRKPRQGPSGRWVGPRPPALTRCRKLRRSRSGGVAAMMPVTFRPRPRARPRTPSNHRARLARMANRSRGAGPGADFDKQLEPEPIRSLRSKTDKSRSHWQSSGRSGHRPEEGRGLGKPGQSRSAGKAAGGRSAYRAAGRRKRMDLRWRRPWVPGGASHVGERRGVGARARPPPRLPRTPSGLWGRGEELPGGAVPTGQEGPARVGR